MGIGPLFVATHYRIPPSPLPSVLTMAYSHNFVRRQGGGCIGGGHGRKKGTRERRGRKEGKKRQGGGGSEAGDGLGALMRGSKV